MDAYPKRIKKDAFLNISGYVWTGPERGILQGDSLSPLLFVIVLIPLTHMLRKASPGYELANSKEKMNHLLFMDNLKLYSKTEKTLDSLIQMVRIFSNDIKMEFGIKKCAILVLTRRKLLNQKE